MAAHHEVWVLTRAKNRPLIEAELRENPVSGIQFVYYDLPSWLGWWRRGPRGVQLYYYLWQLFIYPLAKRLHREIGFDLAHHVTFVKYWSPSLLSLLDIPFIWGPVGGGESAPQTLLSGFSLRGRLYERLRDAARWVGERDPLVRLTAQRSAYALATTPETAARLSQLNVKSVGVLGASALNDPEINYLGGLPQSHNGQFTFVSMGRLLHWKGFHLGLHAFARARVPNARYVIIGDGPERERLKALASELKIGSQVTLTGRLPRADALAILGRSHVLIHPSLHDSSGWVCIEAMAAGHPVICMDLGGPATQITPETGIKVAAHTAEQAIDDLARQMKALASDPELLEEMGRAAKQRVQDKYRWGVKVETLAEIYASLSIVPVI